MKRLYYKCRVCPRSCWHSFKTHNNDKGTLAMSCLHGVTEPKWEEAKYYHKD